MLQLNRILEIEAELRLFRGLRTCHRNSKTYLDICFANKSRDFVTSSVEPLKAFATLAEISRTTAEI